MAVQLPNLPYAENALEPHYSAKTISFHYGKHHKAYVDKLNKLIAGTPLEDKALEEIVMACAGDSSRVGMFKNAAQVWNHTFFWNCMKPAGGGRPKGELAQRIDQAFGSYEKFAEQFKAAAGGWFSARAGMRSAESRAVERPARDGRAGVSDQLLRFAMDGGPEFSWDYSTL